jgi:transposase
MARATRAEWAARVRRWQSSGLTANEFGRREGLNATTLRWWSSALHRNSRLGSRFVDVTTVLAPASTAAGVLEVVVRESVRVRVTAGFDAELLRAVVSALESR